MFRKLTIALLSLMLCCLAEEVRLGEGAKPEFVEKARAGELGVAHLSWWGFDAEDSTALIQDAINTKVETLVIDKMESPWNTKPLHLRSGLTIVFADGAVLQAKRGEYKEGWASVLNIEDCEDVVIRGEGKGGIVRMWKQDYANKELYAKAEWRCCIFLVGGRRIRIENMELRESGGDGILIHHLRKAEGGLAEDLVIRKVRCIDNYRQGISISCGRNILIEDCVLNDTIGTPPEAGIDLESNGDYSDEMMRNIVIRNCKMSGNHGQGILISVTRMDTRTTGPLDILVENCEITDNYLGDIAFGSRTRWPREHELKGDVVFRNLTLSNKVHNHKRRFPIGLEMDVGDQAHLLFENMKVTRGPCDMPAVYVTFCSPTGEKPQMNLEFRNVEFTDTPPEKIVWAFDHSFTGDASWISGVPYTSAPIKQVAPFAGTVAPPLEKEGKESYTELYQVFEPNFWVYGEAGSKGEITLKYRNIGRSRNAVVTFVSPSGERTKLGTLKPNETIAFPFELKESGYSRIEVRAHFACVAMVSSTLPAGIAMQGNQTDLLDTTGDVYFTVPENSQDFAVRVWGRSNILWIGAELYTPDGTLVWDVPATTQAQFDPTPEQRAMAGVWHLKFKKPTKGLLAKYHFALPGLPPYVVIP